MFDSFFFTMQLLFITLEWFKSKSDPMGGIHERKVLFTIFLIMLVEFC